MHARVNVAKSRSFGIILLILGILHVPLPQPDYHSLSHHDRCEGEVCALHNHLLRWHSTDEARPDDAAVLHWHWFWPGRSPVEPGQGDSSIPLLHADADQDWSEPTFQVLAPSLSPERSPVRDFCSLADIISWHDLGIDLTPDGLPFPFLDGSALARPDRAGSTLQRWNC